MDKIFCHICDEELADSIDALPDKCPVCDTRKYEIVQEIKTLEETEEANSQAQTPQIEVISSTPTSFESSHSSVAMEQIVISEPRVVESPVVNDSYIESSEFDSDPQISEPSILRNNIPVVVVEEQDPIETISHFDDESDGQIIFNENLSGIDEGYGNETDVVFEDSPDVVFDDGVVENHVEKNNNIVSENVQVKEKPVAPRVPRKTGASSLEVLPDPDTGFPKGVYLVMYNAEKKAIAYFKIDEAGSIIIGRSSERGSPNDIDITMAWKHAYKGRVDSGTFQEKMKMVKGISRKHALIRYDKSKKRYVFFHLSDKNYTIIKTRQGEKRERPPKNRNPVYLESGSLISMGNHKNYIIMRFREMK